MRQSTVSIGVAKKNGLDFSGLGLIIRHWEFFSIMPITRSGKKSLRVSLRRKAENVRIRHQLQSALKKSAQKNLAGVFSIIDKAAKQRVIHPHKAARLKARASKKFGIIRPVQKVRATKRVARKKTG